MKRRIALRRMAALGAGSLLLPSLVKGSTWKLQTDPLLEAWKGLSGFNRTRYQFRYLGPTKDRPKVFLYGDSISIGYTEYVRCALDGQADLIRLHENGGDSSGLISKMEALRKAMFAPDLAGGWDFKWDLIHFNVGLHDLKYIKDGQLDKVNGTQVNPIPEYKDNLIKDIRYLKETYPGTRLVFCTTTPVPDGEPGRFAGDSKKYNEAALQVLQDYPDILVNDLYSFVKPNHSSWWSAPDNVHYNKTGYRKMGEEISCMIAKEIGSSTSEIPTDAVLSQREKDYLSSLK